jgi:hypothetical protein
MIIVLDFTKGILRHKRSYIISSINFTRLGFVLKLRPKLNNQIGSSTALISVLGVLAGLVAVALFLLVALILLKRYSKQVQKPSFLNLTLRNLTQKHTTTTTTTTTTM